MGGQLSFARLLIRVSLAVAVVSPAPGLASKRRIEQSFGPAVTAALKEPKPGSLAGAAYAFRGLSLLRYTAYQSLTSSFGTSEIEKVLARKSAPAVDAAWRLFFAGALTSTRQLNETTGVAAFFNPIYDGAVLTRWRKDKGAWKIETAQVVLGSSLRKSHQSAAPSWMVSGGNLLETLSASMPKQASFESYQAEPTLKDKDVVLARIAALVGNLRDIKLGAQDQSQLHDLFASIQNGMASVAGRKSAKKRKGKTTTLARVIPARLRQRLTCFGAFQNQNGIVLVYGPMMFPGVAYLIGKEPGKRFTWAAVSIAQAK